METIAIVALTAIAIIILSIIIVYRRVYITHDKRSTKKDFVVNILFLLMMLAFFFILPFDSYTEDVNKNSTMITTQETIIRYFVVVGEDTLLISKNSEIDTLSSGILPDSLNLKCKTIHTIYGETFSKQILE